MAIVPLQLSADSSHRGTVERHVQRTQSPLHLAASADLSGSSWLLSSMKFGSSN